MNSEPRGPLLPDSFSFRKAIPEPEALVGELPVWANIARTLSGSSLTEAVKRCPDRVHPLDTTSLYGAIQALVWVVEDLEAKLSEMEALYWGE